MATEADEDIPARTGVSTTTLVSADDARGMPVHGRDGDKLGTVDKLIFDKRTGQIAYVILTKAGFLGLGQSYHPIPWSAFRYDETQEGYGVTIDKRLLEGAPSYRPDSAPVFDETYGQRVTDYYRVSPEDTASVVRVRG